MKLVILVTVIFFTQSAFSNECEDHVILVVIAKLKDTAYRYMYENRAPKTGPIRCDLIPRDRMNAIQKLKEERENFCKSNTPLETSDAIEGLTFQEKLENAHAGFDIEECNKKNFGAELSTLVRASRGKTKVSSICNLLSPFNQIVHQKNKNTPCKSQTSNTSTSGNCEIAGPDGRCPGSPKTRITSDFQNNDDGVSPIKFEVKKNRALQFQRKRGVNRL